MKCYLYLCVLLSVLLSCNSNNNTYFLPNSLGDSFELVVVKSENSFTDDFYSTFIKYLKIDIGPAPQQENVLSIIEVNDNKFTGLLRRHKNILFFIQDKEFSISIKKNVYAKDQCVIFVTCPSYNVLIEKEQEVKSIVTSIKKVESARWIQAFKPTQNKELAYKLKNIHEILMPVPKNFFLAYSDSNLTWIRRETNKISQGILFANSKNNNLFEVKPANTAIEYMFLNQIDNIINTHVEGPVPGSFMETDRLAPRLLTGPKNNKYTLQSLWRMENDFMGGVYIAEFFSNGLLIYAYVYAPGEEKRIPLLQLETIISSIQIIESN